jgi:hypothetical protein
MYYYVERDASTRNHRNASFVREWRAMQRRNKPGVFATLVCRLTNRTPLQWCPKTPVVELQPYRQATTSCETEGSSRW